MNFTNECDRCGRGEGGLVPHQGEYICTVCEVNEIVAHDMALSAD